MWFSIRSSLIASPKKARREDTEDYCTKKTVPMTGTVFQALEDAYLWYNGRCLYVVCSSSCALWPSGSPR